jgi:SET domain-containing protein
MYIDGRSKSTRNIAAFINSTQPVATTKKPNCIFEGCEGNRIFVCATKTIVPGEELLIDYNLNRIDGWGEAMGVNILHTIQLNL